MLFGLGNQNSNVFRAVRVHHTIAEYIGKLRNIVAISEMIGEVGGGCRCSYHLGALYKQSMKLRFGLEIIQQLSGLLVSQSLCILFGQRSDRSLMAGH